MEFKERLKYRRNELGLTLQQVADYVGVGKATVQRWESGNIANLRRDKIAKLSEILKVSPDYLMGWDDKFEIPCKIRKIAELYLSFKDSDDPKDRALADAVDHILGIDEQ
jgi:transcriptional regulator with XRE-family HTH domain